MKLTESLTKAAHCAQFTADDIRAAFQIANHENPFLAEILMEMIEPAVRAAQKLERLLSLLPLEPEPEHWSPLIEIGKDQFVKIYNNGAQWPTAYYICRIDPDIAAVMKHPEWRWETSVILTDSGMTAETMAAIPPSEWRDIIAVGDVDYPGGAVNLETAIEERFSNRKSK